MGTQGYAYETYIKQLLEEQKYSYKIRKFERETDFYIDMDLGESSTEVVRMEVYDSGSVFMVNHMPGFHISNHRKEALEAVNELNNRYRFVCTGISSEDSLFFKSNFCLARDEYAIKSIVSDYLQYYQSTCTKCRTKMKEVMQKLYEKDADNANGSICFKTKLFEEEEE